MKTSEQIDQISKSMALAQSEMRPASKTSENPFFKSKFSNLSQVWDSIREPLTKNGLSIFQDVASTANGVSISTRVCHSSGQWIEFGPLEINLAKKDPQSLGSATSYGKRYALAAAVGVVSADDDDDDGEKAQQAFRKREAKEITESEEDFNNIINCFPLEDRPKALEYLQKWMATHSKSVAETVHRFSNIDELKDQFYKWLKK